MRIVCVLFFLLLLYGQNVGIGTPTPQVPLHIVYSINSGPHGIYTQNFSSGSIGGKVSVLRARGTYAAPAAVQSGDQLGAFTFGGLYDANLTANQDNAILIEGRATENWTSTARGAALYLQTQQNGTTTPSARMVITHDGRVGIGTPVPTNPLARLHVEGNIYGGFPAVTLNGRVVSACPPGTYPDIPLDAGNNYQNTIPPTSAPPMVINLDGPSRVYVSAFVTMAGQNCGGPASIEWVGIQLRARQGTAVVDDGNLTYEGGRGEYFTLSRGSILDLPAAGPWQIEVALFSNGTTTRVYSFVINAFFVSKL
ncbi:MAG: hypothetical protein ACUVRD_05060 [Bacteroidia bacterium]